MGFVMCEHGYVDDSLCEKCGSVRVDAPVSRVAFDAVLRWIEGEFRKHVFDDKEYLKMRIDNTFGESYKADVTTIRQELKKHG